ncbi:BatD family protein [bacterium]
MKFLIQKTNNFDMKEVFIKTYIFIIFIFVVFFKCFLFGATGITVYSDIDKNYVGLDESITLRLTIAGAGYFSTPKLPEIKSFFVIQTRQYTGIDFSQGRPVPYTVFEYLFNPYKKGKFVIPEIFVEYKGYYYSSDKYDVTVTDKVRRIKEAAVPFEQLVDTRGLTADPIFIKSSISKNNVFYNEQIVYTYTIFTRVSLQRLPKIVFPEYEAFHKEPLYYRKEYLTKINGIQYRAFEFKTALFPFMTDDHVIPGVKMVCSKACFPQSVIQNTDVRNYFSGGRSTFTKKSKGLKVNISPLPLKDKPLSFSGLIGVFDIVAEVDKKEITMDDYLVLTVHVKGSGNIRSIPDIEAPLMDKLREYQSDSFMNYDKKKGKIIGEKLFRIVLLPRDLGRDEIPSIGFSYFDEEQGTYLTKWTEPIEIKIIKSKKKVVKDKPEREGQKAKKSDTLTRYFIAASLFVVLLLIWLVKKKK